jgi:hypothetical protein
VSDTRKTVTALEILLDHSRKNDGGTVFFQASKGPLEKASEKTVFCVTSDPIFRAILLTLKDGLDELKEENGSETTRKQLIAKIQEQLTVAQTLLQLVE